ncbi:DUF4440 domain-containing protein [Chitinophaga sp. sic0106]|uniref:YybH family protein n=1 Tax=Chitinophaga sp. sic0106 TaxID=2854785 RepID=UPI001C466467|nr:nuclear transport factor 2 family protein [Chitinophaga sp. sic0106]MBV7533080.1 nuclear transport factor 2 family protein [Chitinophaga sp. sic0106]
MKPLLIIMLLALPIGSHAQVDWRSKLTAINQLIDNAWATRDLNGIMTYYHTKSVVMPEYNPTLYGKGAIQTFISAWLDSVKHSNTAHTFTDVQVLKNHVIEIGNYTTTLLYGDNAPYIYHAKYMQIWDITSPASPALLTQIQGSTGYIDRKVFPTITVLQKAIPSPEKNKIQKLIDAKNDTFEDNVKQRNGANMARLYTTDAIYMPYYATAIQGIDSINAYYVVHEDPNVGIDQVEINISSLKNLGDFVLVNGYYKVHWKAGDNKGIVTGKSINVWRRQADGDYKMYRQMVVHD